MPFDDWMTPPPVIELARKCLGTIDIDPASNYVAQSYVSAKKFCVSSLEYDYRKDSDCYSDGLEVNWIGNVWCNPPYSKGLIDAFSEKMVREFACGNVGRALFLVNSATDSRWYHKLLNHCTATVLWRGRIRFWKIFGGKAHEKWEGEKSKAEGKGKVGNSPRYLNTLFYFDEEQNVTPLKEYFGNKGTIVFGEKFVVRK